MKDLSQLIGTPTKDKVRVLYKGNSYIATEEDIRFLQTLVIEGKEDAEDYTIIETYSGLEMWQKLDSDGSLIEPFHCNILKLNSNFTMEVLKGWRKLKSL